MRKLTGMLVLTVMATMAVAGEMENTALSGGLSGLKFSAVKGIELPAPKPEAVKGAKQRKQLSCRIYGSEMDTFRDSNLSATIVSNTKLMDLTFRDLATGIITASEKVVNGNTAYKPTKPSRKETYPYSFEGRSVDYTIYLPKQMMLLESFKSEITANVYGEGGMPEYKTAYCRVK
jgi:hypothetical protein